MAAIKADEITKILKEQIENFEQSVAVEEVGSVISVGDGIARVHGLEKVMAAEMVAFPHNVFGIALNLEEDQVGVVLLGEYTEIKEGDTVKRTRTIMSVPGSTEVSIGMRVPSSRTRVSKRIRGSRTGVKSPPRMDDIRFHFPLVRKPVIVPSTSAPGGITSRSKAYTGSMILPCTRS